VFLGLTGILTEPPDLVVSGTNDGANLGPVTVFSGTVGATIASIAASVPAIALSTDPPTEDPEDPAYATHFGQVADFAVELIGRLQANADAKGLLPERTALNVNYPPLPPEEIAGIKMAVQGQASNFSLAYEKIIDDPPVALFVPALGPPAPGQEEVKDADSPFFAQGFLTIVPIDGDYTASRPALPFVKNSIFGDDDEGGAAD
jgi:5'/3'-nucleotidase SurE